MRNAVLKFAASAATLFFVAACATSTDTYETPNLVETAADDPGLSTLTTAITEAELIDTLSGPGPFTVFAPTNAAFDKLPDGTVAMLLEESNEEQLRGILTYHVVSGTITGVDLLEYVRNSGGLYTFATLNGQSLTAFLDDEELMLRDNKGNEAAIVSADIRASNGVIHVIDTVVSPR